MRYVLILAVGLTCRAQNLPKFGVDVDLVRVACSVTGRNGLRVADLRREDFALLDNGKPRAIQHLWTENDLPLIVGLIADVSGSQSRYVEHHRQTLAQFLERVLRPRDQAFLATVASDVRLITDLTSSVQELKTGVQEIGKAEPSGTELGDCLGPSRFRLAKRFPNFGCGTTALWNGVYFASLLKMKAIDGRKALIILSDGIDAISPHTLNDAIQAAQSADTLVYTIRYPQMTGLLSMFSMDSSGRAHLHRLSEETGGRAYNAPRNGPAEVFFQIEEELRNLYVVGFTVPERDRDGKVHRLEVRSKHGDVRMRTRKQYVLVR